MHIDDAIFLRCAEPMALRIFVPERPEVVMGSSNQAHREVRLDACEELGIPVLRRAGGGGTVVLYPGCVVISLGTWVKEPFQNSAYFQKINRAVIAALAHSYPKLQDLSLRGISDIAWQERKIAGTSLFRSRGYLSYQASLLVELDRELVERCLQHPSLEPDYRQGKTHRDFLTSLAEAHGSPLSAAEVASALQDSLEAELRRELGHDLIPPDEQHLKHILRRVVSH